MNTEQDSYSDRLFELLEQLYEDQISDQQLQELEQLLHQNAAARKTYLEYIQLHGLLHWITAKSVAAPEDIQKNLEQTHRPQTPEAQITTLLKLPPETNKKLSHPVHKKTNSSSWQTVLLSTTAVILLLAVGYLFRGSLFSSSDVVSPQPVKTNEENLASNKPPSFNPSSPEESQAQEANQTILPSPPLDRVKISDKNRPTDQSSLPVVSQNETDTTPWPTEKIVSFINQQLNSEWDQHQIAPSPKASSTEWIRRVYLDLHGHIPARSDVVQFLENRSPKKKTKLVNDLLEHPDYVRNLTTNWTNLLIGRLPSSKVDRQAFVKFLEQSFAQNRPWNEIVADLLDAEGNQSRSGATNYLIAHLNNQAVPATSITARLFFGRQIGCTQCHDHPFNDWKQSQFWEFNSFFKQTTVKQSKRKNRRGFNNRLLSDHYQGPVFFEDRQGLVQAAFPKLYGIKVDTQSQLKLRSQLAELVKLDQKYWLAEAFVSRLWGHFFGYGFTNPIDDLGPHNPTPYPELLKRLTLEFVKSDYNIKELTRWICLSEAYQLSSQLTSNNQIDQPEIGEIPLFSRAYLKTMSSEQLFDSILIATHETKSSTPDWSRVEKERQEWIEEFVTLLKTEENQESSQFHGSISQALMMMNGKLIQQGLSTTPGTLFHQVIQQKESLKDKINRLFLATLSRYPTAQELKATQKMIRQYSSRSFGKNPIIKSNAQAESLQDLFWALLNSNEFILVH